MFCSIVESSQTDDRAPYGAPDEDDDWHAPMMRELAQLGMRMARTVTLGAEARAQAGASSADDEAASSLALHRAGKLVRLTVALDERLKAPAAAAVDLRALQPALDEVAAERQQAEADAHWVMRALWKAMGQPLVRNTIALAIEAESDGAERERLYEDLHERLEDREGELVSMGPGRYGDAIKDLLDELGLSDQVLNLNALTWPDRPSARAARMQAANDPADPSPDARVRPPP